MKKKSNQGTKASSQTAQRDAVLAAILPQIAFDGWTDAAYVRGLDEIGMTRGEADLLFPQAMRDVIELFGAKADDAMLARIEEEPGFARLKVREKIAFAVRARLHYWQPHREAVRRMMFWYALPFNLVLGIKRLSKTVDLMWRAAGDTSTDFNFYTKRTLLAGVLKTTILFWLDDDSPGSRASWDFLDRRISEVLKVGKTISLMKEWTPSELVDIARRKMRA
ncbi:MAG: COQ9 family protein [Alphaproteobacteria bacterium]